MEFAGSRIRAIKLSGTTCFTRDEVISGEKFFKTLILIEEWFVFRLVKSMNSSRGLYLGGFSERLAEKTPMEKLCEDLLLQSKANGVALERMREQILALQKTIEELQEKKEDVKKILDA